MTPVSPKVIHLADLQRYIFTDDYKPQVAATGEHELSFLSSRGVSAASSCHSMLTRTDMREFLDRVDELAKVK